MSWTDGDDWRHEVKRSGWNPNRRNRNIGTAKSGHGLANRLVIPDSWNDPRVFWEKLRDPVIVEQNGFTIVVEPTSPGFAHAVTVGDVLRVLGLIPHEDVQRIRAVALRQPTRKQRVLSCVWGRLAYFAELGTARGPTVIIEAQAINGSFQFPRSATPDRTEELDRLRADGHTVTSERRHWSIQTTLESVRSTQLYRTLPHEVGHYVHYDREVRIAAKGDVDEELRLQDMHFTKAGREKEDFAHRYAREFYENMSAQRRVPFERVLDTVRTARLGLDPIWFGS
jgi:hypothetical protein